jgi:membrane-bound lytic murein transglycosylase A
MTPADDAAARRWMEASLDVWQLAAADGQTQGLATAYFEPLLDAWRQPHDGATVPLHAPPAGLDNRRPFFSRHALASEPAAQATLAGRELAWLQDPIDLMLLQIQGSGRLRLHAPDGSVLQVRAAFAGHNGHPYRSPGRWLLDQGELRGNTVSWGAIRAWALQNPERVGELMAANPRVVFFRLEPLPDPSQGPRGAQGVPLTAWRSVAVDPRAVPYGTPMWLDTRDPSSGHAFQRAVVAQDTGAAIVGGVRIDLFTGSGDDAGVQASRWREPLRAWALWPRDRAAPVSVEAR